MPAARSAQCYATDCLERSERAQKVRERAFRRRFRLAWWLPREFVGCRARALRGGGTMTASTALEYTPLWYYTPLLHPAMVLQGSWSEG